MTDTRKKTNRGNYDKEQEESLRIFGYYGDQKQYYGKPDTTYLPGNGIANIRLCACDLANNSIDIESMLRGTGSQNMVNPQAAIVPDFKYIKTANIYEKEVYVPEPLAVRGAQRPLWR